MTPRAQELVANSVPVDAVPVRGKFAEWRVRVKRPKDVETKRPFYGAHERRCWLCLMPYLSSVSPMLQTGPTEEGGERGQSGQRLGRQLQRRLGWRYSIGRNACLFKC